MRCNKLRTNARLATMAEPGLSIIEHGVVAPLHRWLDMAREKIRFQGMPARICSVGLGDRHRLGLAFNAMVASGELKAPAVIRRVCARAKGLDLPGILE